MQFFFSFYFIWNWYCHLVSHAWQFCLFKKDFIYLSLEGKGRKGERERNINVWLLLMCSLLGTGLQPRHVLRLGIQQVTLWFSGPHSFHWAIPARATLCLVWPSFRVTLQCLFEWFCSFWEATEPTPPISPSWGFLPLLSKGNGAGNSSWTTEQDWFGSGTRSKVIPGNGSRT